MAHSIILSPSSKQQPSDMVADDNDNTGVSSHTIDLNYVPFDDIQKQQEVDKRIFLPLYATTACVILFTGFLPTFLVVILVTLWAFVFVGTPLYYLYHYHPDSVNCYGDVASNTNINSRVTDKSTSALMTRKNSLEQSQVLPPGRTASV